MARSVSTRHAWPSTNQYQPRCKFPTAHAITSRGLLSTTQTSCDRMPRDRQSSPRDPERSSTTAAHLSRARLGLAHHTKRSVGAPSSFACVLQPPRPLARTAYMPGTHALRTLVRNTASCANESTRLSPPQTRLHESSDRGVAPAPIESRPRLETSAGSRETSAGSRPARAAHHTIQRPCGPPIQRIMIGHVLTSACTQTRPFPTPPCCPPSHATSPPAQPRGL